MNKSKRSSSARSAKSQMISFRVNDAAAKDMETIRSILQKRRGPGANEVTRTEVIQILIELGSQKFLSENK